MRKKFQYFSKKSLILLIFLCFSTLISRAQNCNCSYTISAETTYLDGAKAGIKPGAIVCLQAGKKSSLWLENFNGTKEKPIKIINCGGQVEITNKDKWGISISYSEHFELSGSGDPNHQYGIKVNGVATVGVSFNRLTTDFKAHHIEVTSKGPGVIAKTDPDCADKRTLRGSFVMKNVELRNFYVHDVGSKAAGGEGFYIGHSFNNGIDTNCGKLYPHTIENIKIHDNIIQNSAFDGMQVSCAVKGTEVYNNSIRNFGTVNNGGQQSGLVIGGGTKGKFYNNKIDKGTGIGVCVFGLGDIYLYNNVISNTDKEGVFVDDRGTEEDLGFYCYNNTVVNSKLTGILTYNAKLKINVFYNNLIVNPGNWRAHYDYKKAFIYLENIPSIKKVVKYDTAHNLFIKDITDASFVDASKCNFDVKSACKAIDRGKNIASLGIVSDVNNKKRPSGKGYDIGAYEYGGTSVPQPPSALSLIVTSTPASCNASNGRASVTVAGGTSPYTYAWSNGKTTATIENLSSGTYRVTVKDKNNKTAAASVSVGQSSGVVITYTKTDATSTTKGSIDLTISGGSAPYVCHWSNNASTQDLTGLSAGTYSVTVKDKYNCRKNATIVIAQSTTPQPPTNTANIYNIISKHTGKYLGVQGASHAAKGKIEVRDKSNTTSQQWKVEAIGNGYYKITNVNSGKVLDVEGSSSADGANVIQNPFVSSECQKWKLVDIGGGYYTIVAKCSGRGIEVKGGATANGSLVGQWTYWGGEYQKWKLQKISGSARLGEDEGIEVEQSVGDIEVYPNPAPGAEIKLKIKAEKQEAAVITLTNTSSEKELVLNEQIQAGENSITVPVKNLANGLYLISIERGNKRTVKRILIAK